MSIQQAINQGLSTAGIAARLSPEYETRQQTYALEQEKKKLIAEGKKLSEETKGDVAKQIIDSAELGIPNKLAATNEKLAYLGQASPELAAESLRQSKMHSDIAKGLQSKKISIKPMTTEQFLMERQKAANEKAKGEAQAKKAQKANFRKSILLDAQGQNLTVPVDMEGKR